jgi:hypothetical protein
MEEWIQPIMILYRDVTAAGEQTSMPKLSVPQGKKWEKYYCEQCLSIYDLCHS